MQYILFFSRIDDQGIIKVADFGLSEEVYAQDYFRQSSKEDSESGPVKLPIKWMALESLHDGIFSVKTDVVSIYSSIFKHYNHTRS